MRTIEWESFRIWFDRKVRQFRDYFGDVLDSQWKSILGLIGNDDYYLYVWGNNNIFLLNTVKPFIFVTLQVASSAL
jgi:hypothetical protein